MHANFYLTACFPWELGLRYYPIAWFLRTNSSPILSLAGFWNQLFPKISLTHLQNIPEGAPGWLNQ